MSLSTAGAGFESQCGTGLPSGPGSSSLISNFSPLRAPYQTVANALVKPMPGNLMTPSLAESWTMSADQRIYDFKLREGLRFHNGDPFTADDVKFSFDRSKAGKALKDQVREVEVVGPARVRFHLHEPFPDFMAYYGTVLTGAGWIVPRKYIEKID